MRTQLLALTVFIAAVGGTMQLVSTASNDLAVTSKTLSYRAVGIQNTSSRATSLKSVSYTNLLPGTTTEVKAVLSGDLLLRTIRARYGSDTPVNCSKTLLSVVGGLLGAKDTEITCGAFNEDADRPRSLTFLIS